MLIAASSISGAPGVSSWSLMLGAAWPGDDLRNRIFVEADTSGGVLAVRYGLSPTPGIVELISNVRQGVVLPESLEASGHRLGEKLWAVPSLGSADAAWPVLVRMGELGSVLSSGDDVWFVDCGRWWPTTPNVGVTSEADLNLIFVDAADSSLLSVRSRVNHFRQFGPVGVVVVGTTRRTLEELEQNFAADMVWKIPYVKQLDLLAGQAATTTKKVRRSKGWRYALSVSSDLRDLLSQFGENASTDDFGVAQVQSVEPSVPVQSIEPSVPVQSDQRQGQSGNTDRQPYGNNRHSASEESAVSGEPNTLDFGETKLNVSQTDASQRLTYGIVSGTGEVPIDLSQQETWPTERPSNHPESNGTQTHDGSIQNMEALSQKSTTKNSSALSAGPGIPPAAYSTVSRNSQNVQPEAVAQTSSQIGQQSTLPSETPPDPDPYYHDAPTMRSNATLPAAPVASQGRRVVEQAERVRPSVPADESNRS